MCDLQERLAAEAGLLKTAHRPFTFHDGSHSSRITLSDGNKTSRRNDSYHAICFSNFTIPTEPAYYEVQYQKLPTAILELLCIIACACWLSCVSVCLRV